jgi:antitoxin HigA-1
MAVVKNLPHPGEVLKELYLDPLDMSAIALARELNVPRTRIERLVKCETALSADTAMRLSKFFSTTPEYWLNLQQAWDLARARIAINVSDIEPFVAIR